MHTAIVALLAMILPIGCALAAWWGGGGVRWAGGAAHVAARGRNASRMLAMVSDLGAAGALVAALAWMTPD